MDLNKWGWVIRGLRGLINLMKELRQYGTPINTTFQSELDQCSKEIAELASQTRSLNQDEDQGARGQPATTESQSPKSNGGGPVLPSDED